MECGTPVRADARLTISAPVDRFEPFDFSYELREVFMIRLRNSELRIPNS